MGAPQPRLGLDADTLKRLMASRGVDATDPQELLAAARLPHHKLAVTLLSCWAAEGHPLTKAQSAELTAYRSRSARYAEVWATLHDVAPAAYVLKGPQIAALYPEGIMRASGDLDVVSPQRDQLWAAAGTLLDAGWQVEAFTLFPRSTGTGADRVDVLTSIQCPPDPGIRDPYEVELRTTDIATSVRRPGVRLPWGGDDPVTASVIALVAERFERRFTSRDILDLAMLSQVITPSGWQMVRDGLTAARLRPQWRDLYRDLIRTPMDRTRLPLPEMLITLPQRLRDRGGAAASWARPLKAAGYLATTTVDADRGRLADRAVRALHERVGAPRLFASGVPLYGVPVDHQYSGDDIRLVEHGRRLLALTPVGSFLMVAGACPQQWLDDLTTDDLTTTDAAEAEHG